MTCFPKSCLADGPELGAAGANHRRISQSEHPIAGLSNSLGGLALCRCRLRPGVQQHQLERYPNGLNRLGRRLFSKLRAHLRKIAERTVAGLMRALEARADFFKSAECTNYFAACGYDTT